MLITRLKLKNWRNFRQIDVALRERVFVIGPNAAGKSNLLDALRFLRDIAKPMGGGLQRAVETRGGMAQLRSLLARRDPEVEIGVEIAERADEPPTWRYELAFRSESKGRNRVVITREKVEDLRSGLQLLDRPDGKDREDTERLTETSLEQINANKDFREIAQFFGGLTYLHLVPQLLKHAELGSADALEDDPFGQAFLDRIAKTTPRTRDSRLKKMDAALKACIPNMRDLRFERDPATGAPHLGAIHEHWRPETGRQREDQFSDGTLRLLGILWSLLDGDSLLLLEEPELSLHDAVVREIPPLLWKMQRQSRHRRQIVVTTHSRAMLEHPSIDPRDVLRLDPTPDGTRVLPATEQEIGLIAAGYTVAEAMAGRTQRVSLAQLASP